jgi:hypothetical protein
MVSVIASGVSLVGHVHHADAGRKLEQLAGKVGAAADSGRTEVDLSGFLLRKRDQLPHGLYP